MQSLKELSKKYSRKVDGRKKHFLIVDTEAKNKSDIYNIGWVVSDKQGSKLVERSFLVKEFYDDIFNSDNITPYYKRKKIKYDYKLEKGLTVIKPYHEIYETLVQDIIEYNTKVFCAYNINYDKSVINKTHYNLTGEIFPLFDNMELLDIWCYACQTIATQKSYKRFCEEHDYFTKKGNMETGAEVMYRYISNDNNFQEWHTALLDSKIESDILNKGLRQRKKVIALTHHNPTHLMNKIIKEKENKQTSLF